jgi:glucose/arabinose dehydrogenase
MRRLNAPFTRTPLPAVVALAAAITSSPALAQLDTTRVASGLNAPIFATTAPGRADQLFIVERSGTIRIMNTATGAVSPTAFLSIPDVDTTFEGGFLGLAFHPDFDTNGKFYVNITTAPTLGGALDTRIREYTVTDPINGNTANPTPTEILSFAQPQANHNGGWIGFKPNDPGANLYIMSGDGGSSNDTGTGHTAGTGNAQDTTDNLLGKVLRINIDADAFPADPNANYAIPTGAGGNPFVGVTGDDEIFAYGLRNPFRASFDRLTGDLYIGDVGQGSREEIDLIPSNSAGGENFGWRLREGDIATPSGGVGGAEPTGNVNPIYDYESFGTGDFTGDSVTGGVLYRGPVAQLYGQYIFADYQDNHVWAFDPANPDATVQKLNTAVSPVIKSNIGNINSVVAFAEDTYGNLYIVDIGGEIFRIGLPGDINADGFVGITDLNIVLGNWNQNVTLGNRFQGDIAGIGDGFVGIDDLNVILTNWNLGTPPPPEVSTNIPEPTTLILCAALLPTLTQRPQSRSRLSDPAKKILDPAHL